MIQGLLPVKRVWEAALGSGVNPVPGDVKRN